MAVRFFVYCSWRVRTAASHVAAPHSPTTRSEIRSSIESNQFSQCCIFVFLFVFFLFFLFFICFFFWKKNKNLFFFQKNFFYLKSLILIRNSLFMIYLIVFMINIGHNLLLLTLILTKIVTWNHFVWSFHSQYHMKLWRIILYLYSWFLKLITLLWW